MTTYDVKEIGYAFLKTYYERMHNDPSKLSCLYSSTAELTHINYNDPIKHDKDYLNTVKLIGKDNINNFFTRNSKRVQDLKVKIDSCDFQSTGYESSSILILTLGELCWTDSPSYRFCQCFILEPAEYNNKIYDLKNDIIRFIPALGPLEKPVSDKPSEQVVVSGSIEKSAEKSVEKPMEKPVEKPAQEPVATPPVVTAKPVEITKPVPKKQDPPVAVAVKSPLSEEKEKEKEKPSAASSVSQASKAKPKAEEEEVQKRSSSPTPSSTTTSTPIPTQTPTPVSTPNPASTSTSTNTNAPQTQAEPVKMTWAGKLNKTSKLTTNYIKVDVSTKKSKSPPPNGFTKQNKKNKQQQQSKPIGDVIIQNSHGYYPVYVGNTNGLTASELEKALIKEYGEVMKTTFQDSFAVVDFKEKSARDAAIEAQHLKVGERTINLNPKGDKASKYKSKNSNGNSNNNNNNNNNSNGNGSFSHNSTHNTPSPSSDLPSSQNNSAYKKGSLKSRNDKSKN